MSLLEPPPEPREDQGYTPPPNPHSLATPERSLSWIRSMQRDLTGEGHRPEPAHRPGRLEARIGAAHASMAMAAIDDDGLAQRLAVMLEARGVANATQLAFDSLELVSRWLLEPT